MSRQPTDWTAIRALAIKALANGAKSVSPTTIEWDISRRCEKPVNVLLWARCDDEQFLVAFHSQNWRGLDGEPMWMPKHPSDYRINVDMLVPCRKCPPCLKARAREWAHRAWSEIRASSRTWFGTITIEPEKHAWFLSLARVRARKEKDLDFDLLPEADRFRLVEREINRELQLMWKRLRKAGHRFRYECVCESSPDHQSGLPHYHVLVHELATPIPHAALAGRRANRKRGTPAVECPWPHGFVSVKLVDDDRRAAWYCAKYLSKDARYRIRASLRYGREPFTASADSSGVSFFERERKKRNSSLAERETLSPQKGEETPQQTSSDWGLTIGSDDADLSSAGISEQGRSQLCDGAGLSKAAAAYGAGQRQSAAVDWPPGERQSEAFDDIPF